MKKRIAVFGIAIIAASWIASAQTQQQIQENIPGEVTDDLAQENISEFRDRAQENIRDLKTFSRRAQNMYQGQVNLAKIGRQCRALDATLSEIPPKPESSSQTPPKPESSRTTIQVTNTGSRASNFLVTALSSDETRVILPVERISPEQSSTVTLPESVRAEEATVNAVAGGVSAGAYFTPVCQPSESIEISSDQPEVPELPETSDESEQTPPVPEGSNPDSSEDAEQGGNQQDQGPAGGSDPQEPDNSNQNQEGQSIVEQVLGGIL
jgi:hypothetical protein